MKWIRAGGFGCNRAVRNAVHCNGAPVPIPVSAFMAFQAAFSVTVHGFRRNCVFLTGYFIGAPIEITHFIGAPIKKHPPITPVSKNVSSNN
jgi:hypothetical protein